MNTLIKIDLLLNELVYTGKIKKGKVIKNKFGKIDITWSQGRSTKGGIFSASIEDKDGNYIERLSGYLRIGDITKDAKAILNPKK